MPVPEGIVILIYKKQKMFVETPKLGVYILLGINASLGLFTT